MTRESPQHRDKGPDQAGALTLDSQASLPSRDSGLFICLSSPMRMSTHLEFEKRSAETVMPFSAEF